MKYLTMPADQMKFFVLFHGTGGNEYSLLSVTGELDPEASILSFLGETGSGRGRRYFAPLVSGKLPRPDFEEKVDEFLELWDSIRPQDAELTFIGYSNGANFILGILEKRPDIAQNIILLHPSNLDYHFSAGSNSRILLTSGASDTLSIPGTVRQLANQLTALFPNTHLALLDSGHELTEREVEAVAQFLNRTGGDATE